MDEFAKHIPIRVHNAGRVLFFALAAGLTGFYFWLLVSVVRPVLPKTAFLQRRNDAWKTEIALFNREMDRCEVALTTLELRNEDVYRSIFGLNEIPLDAVGVQFDNPERYEILSSHGVDGRLADAYRRLDMLSGRAYLQVKSYDEVAALSRHAGNIASCIPAIAPINPAPGTYKISSSFGRRVDPVSGGAGRHMGVDFATRNGNPVYATGDGVVESVAVHYYGYGNIVVINHGYGYKTRYAHLSIITVSPGMEVKRGTCIGAVGNTGKSTGNHLHYEVLYKGHNINPYDFYDLNVSPSEYAAMVQPDDRTKAMYRPAFQVKSKKKK
ncbi:MAG: M23 family metallopeptidase [Bacteroidales bacterium]|nr:M23 family metallopeptidase [Bacteroidales bacterium]